MNDFNLNLYHHGNEKALENQLIMLLETLCDAPVDAVVCGKYFVVPHDCTEKPTIFCLDCHGLFSLRKEEYIVSQDQLLNTRNLVLGKHLTDRFSAAAYNEQYSRKVLEFHRWLLRYEYEWIEGYVEHLKSSLAERISEGRAIIQHEAVRLEWANLMERVECLRHVLESLVDTSSANEAYILAPNVVREICELAAKLAGGRAFLEGQAVEMLWLFQIFNKIYLAGGMSNE